MSWRNKNPPTARRHIFIVQASVLKTRSLTAKVTTETCPYQMYKLKENEPNTSAKTAAHHTQYNTQSPPASRQRQKSRRPSQFSFTTDNSIQPQSLMLEYRP